MTHNPLDHSYLLDINLTVHAELADKFYDAYELGGYKNKRLTQLQVLLANLIANHQTDPDLYTSVSLADGFYKPQWCDPTVINGRNFYTHRERLLSETPQL